MDLSPQGDEHVDEILPLIFQYLAMLRASSPLPRWLFDECAAIGEMGFRFKDRPCRHPNPNPNPQPPTPTRRCWRT